MNIPIRLSETTRIDDEGNVRTYATLDADALLERLNSGGMEEQEAANRIRELEAQLETELGVAEGRDATIEKLRVELSDARRALADHAARDATLEAALRDVQWVGEWRACPWCYGSEKYGHREGCARQAALEPARQSAAEVEAE